VPQYATLTLHGDPYTMGRQHGEQVRNLRPQIAEAIDARFHQLEKDGPDARFETLVQDTYALLEEIDAPLLAMIRGQAEALGFDFAIMLRYNLIAFLRDDLLVRHALDIEGCTTWAASGSATAGGAPILAKNRDYRPDHLPLQSVIRATPDTGHASVARAAQVFFRRASTGPGWPWPTPTSTPRIWAPVWRRIR
jgi:hypothetical protein